MKNLANYIQNLKFEYAISYSGLKGVSFLNLEIENKEKIKKLEKEIELARFIQKPKLNKKIEALEAEINLHNSRVINKKGELHKTAKTEHRFNKKNKEIDQILEIMNYLGPRARGIKTTSTVKYEFSRTYLLFLDLSNTSLLLLH